MRTGGGRIKNAIWQYFLESQNDDGKISVKCSFCQQDVSPKVQRLQNHLDKCSAYQGDDSISTPSTTTTITAGPKAKDQDKHKKSFRHLETQLKRLQNSIKRLEQTIENIRNWVSNSYGEDIPEECFVIDIEVENTPGINNESAEDLITCVKTEFKEPAEEDEDGFLNFDPDLIEECINKETDENMGNLLDDDEMLKVQNDTSSHKLKRTRKDSADAEDPEFILPDAEDNDSDLDYGKRRRVSLRKTKPKNYNFTNNVKNSYNAKCRICKRVFKSVSYLNYIHMPTHKGEHVQVQKKPKTGGRTKSSVWQYFTQIEEEIDGKVLSQSICNFCKQNVSSKAPRLRRHLNKCPGQEDVSVKALTRTCSDYDGDNDNDTTVKTRKTDHSIKKGYFRFGGRVKSDVWQHFNTTTEQVEGKFFKVSICRNCGKNVSAKVGRLQRHLEICSSAQKDPSLSGTRPTVIKVKRKNENKHGGGRTKSDIWQFFTTSKTQNEDGKIVDVSVCNFCLSRVSPKSSRLQAHIEKCLAYHSDEGEPPNTNTDTEQVDTSTSIPNQTITCHTPKDKDKEGQNQNPTFICPDVDCESAFFSDIRLKIHLKRIHNISSEPPGEFNKIKKHKISKYVQISKPLVAPDGTPLFNCPLETCPSSFQAIVYLKKHLKRVHNIPPTSRPYNKTININPESNDYTKPKTYMCPVCGKILMLGSKEVHDATHENKKQYRCDICPAAFNLRQHLLKHRNMHTREKIHTCDQCGKEFLRLEGLKLHQNTVHSDARSFICEFPNCDKSYKIKRQLVIHQRAVHIVQKPYKCNLCSTKSFHTELGLKDHLLRSHKNELEQDQEYLLDKILSKSSK